MAWVSDDELVEEFTTKYGQKPGPIVDSTRGLYRRKLAQLRADETKSREYGQKPGPIVDSTRGLYRRKLVQLRADEKSREEEEEPASSVRLRSTKIQHSKEPPSRYPRSTRPCPPQSSSILSLVLGVALLLLVMFAIMVLIYNTLHTTKPCPCPPTIPQSNRSHPQSSSTWSSVLSVVPLLVVFAIMLLI